LGRRLGNGFTRGWERECSSLVMREVSLVYSRFLSLRVEMTDFGWYGWWTNILRNGDEIVSGGEWRGRFVKAKNSISVLDNEEIET